MSRSHHAQNQEPDEPRPPRQSVTVGLGLVLRPPSDPMQPENDPAAWRVLVTRRPGDTVLGGRLEFPGGKVEPGESVPDAVVRELQEEVGLRVRAVAELAVVEHVYDHATVRLHAWWCQAQGELPDDDHAAQPRWLLLDALPLDQFPEANRALVQRVLAQWPTVRSRVQH